jgi:diguanylate cyclase (GGDEF)-like protein/PAS domain S-box-containing protein
VLVAQVGVPEPWASARVLPVDASPGPDGLTKPDPLALEELPAGEWLKDYPQASYCALTLRLEGETVAVLAAADVRRRRWTEEEVSLLGDVAAGIMRELELHAQAAAEEALSPLLDPHEGQCRLDAGWRFTSVNAVAEVLLRRDRAALVGRSIWDVYPRLAGSTLQHDWQQGLAAGTPVETETYWPDPDRWLECRLYRALDGSVLHLRDVSGRHQALEELREREARWRELFDESGSAIFTTGPDGVLTDYNRTLLQLLGLTSEAAAHTDLAELCVEEERTALRHALEQGSTSDLRLRLQRGDGQVLSVALSATVRRSAAGEVIGWQGVLRDVTERARLEEQLAESAYVDNLTQLPNRKLLVDRLERLLRHSLRHTEYRFGVLFVDLDRFKQVNDTHGHLVGDRLLEGTARRLERCVRQGDTVARVGGDEFAILLDGITDAPAVIQVAERILLELRQPFPEFDLSEGVGASIGIALSTTGYDNIDDVLRDADTAMYRAKARGRNRYMVFDTEMYGRMRLQLELEADLRHALQRNQLAIHYHPVVSLQGGNVAGMEALLRWAHPERGVLLPGEFIALAERTGLIVDIGWWVLREACRQLRAWQLEYPASTLRLSISVNFSARQFLQPNLLQKLDVILNETGIDPGCLRLELTESVVTQDGEQTAKLLQEIRCRGIHVCIDDFGTGYSSLQELKELPISGVKIAPMFVQQMEQEGSRAVVQTIIALGDSMAIEAIAEGVETPEQLDRLRALGTRFAQGFLFSLPLEAEAARALIAN